MEYVDAQVKIEHERAYARQAEDLAYYFAKPLGKSRLEYLDSLPLFSPQLKRYQGRFENLVLVQPPTPKLPLKRILDTIGLSVFIDGVLKAQDWTGGKFITPSVPYLTYLDDGTKNLNVVPSVVRQKLAEDARAGNLLDGIYLWVYDRGILKSHLPDLPGSEVPDDSNYPLSRGGIPCFRMWGAKPGLADHFVDDANPNWGSVVAGRKVATKGNEWVIPW